MTSFAAVKATPCRTQLAALALIAATLNGCGGSGDKPKAATTDYSDPASIASALDKGGFACTSFAINSAAVGPKASGDCQHGDASVSISVFDSAAQRDRVLKTAQEAFGASGDASGTAAVDGAWLVTTQSAEQVQQVQKVIGGKIQ
jgi:hypothetical protein